MAQQLARLAEDVRELQRENSGLRSEHLIAAGQQMVAGKKGAPTSPTHVCESAHLKCILLSHQLSER